MNKKNLFVLLGFLLLFACGFYLKKKYYDPKQKLSKTTQQVKELSDSNKLKNGDIIFQTSLSSQSKAIQLATHSKYSHCGLIFHSDTGTRDWYVLEAVKTVRYTPLDKWICRGDGGHYVIKRVKTDPQLSDEMLLRLKGIGEKFLKKDYDWYFEWSDDKIYCSELVWKAYNELNGLEIGNLQKLQELDLTNESVKAKMKERYGDKIPLDEKMITPASIFDSDLLVLVDEK
ncbi:MAG TPA: YiiX family permuted papain-like enzyme [Bacteroidia bacterium]|jgi:uncharacterized protein YycO|nr:YiiX family permuted papain-like enzyme [Bacteroidia bacterium]